MKNWDERDETGKCPSDADWADVCATVALLPTPRGATHPPPVRLDFSREYWADVFSPMVAGYATGTSTPNPDVACNRAIKFGLLRDRCLSLGADAFATGHYARLKHAGLLSTARDAPAADGAGASAGELPGKLPELWTAADLAKDQTYFLSAVPRAQFRGVLFPVGQLASKQCVRRLASEAQLPAADKRDSVGICFIGKRRFGDFLTEYVAPTPGRFVSAVDGADLGPHKGLELYTVGQGARIKHQDLPRVSPRPLPLPPRGKGATGVRGAAKKATDGGKWFVVGRDAAAGAVLVAPGSMHPALFCDALQAGPGTWLEHIGPALSLRCAFRVRHRQDLAWCTATPMHEGRDAPHHASSPTVPTAEPWLSVAFEEPMRAVTEGQHLVLYAPGNFDGAGGGGGAGSGDDAGVGGVSVESACGATAYRCLGGATITARGPTYFEAGRPLPPGTRSWAVG